jgi:flagellar hook protein FlgE
MAFQQGLSGLNSASTHLDVISRNIANSNTVGYKSGETQFADLFARSASGGAGGIEVGIGTRVMDVAKQFDQGKLSSTNNPLDVSINGEGFFKLNDDGAFSYTRNGQLHLDKSGYLKSNTDLTVRGYVEPITNTATGAVTGFNTEGDIRVDFAPIPAVATDSVRLGINLDERSSVITSNTLGLGTVPIIGGITSSDYNHATTVSVTDSAGSEHDLTLYFCKTAANEWNVYATADQAGGSIIYNFGAVTFNTDGSFYTPEGGTLSVGVDGIDVNADGKIVDPLNITITVHDPASTDSMLTQYAAGFGVHLLEVNGQTSGELTSLSIGNNGIINGQYSNGQTRNLAQIMLASFRDPQGLVSLGSNQWQATEASGEEIPNRPGEGIAGMLQSGSVEDSNVDLTAELVNLIIAQRTYQANAQSVKTQSDLLQTLVNMV